MWPSSQQYCSKNDPLLYDTPARGRARSRLTWLWVLAAICSAAVLYSTRSQWLILTKHKETRCQPLEVHLGVTEDPTTMRVTWRTRESDCPTTVVYAPSTPCDIEWRRSARKVFGVSYEGDSAMLCGSRASQYDFDLFLHTAVMTGLVPNESYDYGLPNDDHRFTFTASKPAGDTSEFVFFVFGDMGVTVDKHGKYEGAEIVQSKMLKEIERGVPDLMLDVGDIAYANGNPFVWEAFMSAIQPISSQSLWVASVGNHEYDMEDDGQLDPWGLPPFQPTWGNMDEGDAYGECGLHVYWRFPFGEFYAPMQANSDHSFLPAPSHGDPFPPFYYSFDQGLVHVVTISTEHDVEADSAQIAWLEKDLASVDRCATPFIVVTGHRPFYAPARDKKDSRTGEGLRQRLEDLLIRYKVDVYISGHVHSYYRLCEARNGICVPPGEGLVSMVIGSGGHELDEMDRDDFEFEDMTLALKWGFGKFSVRGHESMDFQFVEAVTGEILDSYQFINRGNCVTPQGSS